MMLIIEKFGSLDDRIAFTPASPCNCTDSGYVTCSSMSCGLRPIQSAKTMTWFSDRSGMASTGVRSSAHTPQIATPSQARITSQRFRTENSMIFAIMIFILGVELGSRIDTNQHESSPIFEFIRGDSCEFVSIRDPLLVSSAD